MTLTHHTGTKILRPLIAGFTAIALLSACDEAAVTPVPSVATSPEAVTPAAVDALHEAQTVGGPVDSSRLAQALSICLDNIPDVGTARQQMIVAGFRRETTIDGQDLYSAADRSVFALLSIGNVAPRCAVGRDGLRDQAAIAFAESALRQAYGPAFVPADPADFSRPVIAGWVANPPSGVLAIGVTRAIDLAPFFLGSFIMVTTNVEVSDEN
jgi:hypothetical protein